MSVFSRLLCGSSKSNKKKKSEMKKIHIESKAPEKHSNIEDTPKTSSGDTPKVFDGSESQDEFIQNLDTISKSKKDSTFKPNDISHAEKEVLRIEQNLNEMEVKNEEKPVPIESYQQKVGTESNTEPLPDYNEELKSDSSKGITLEFIQMKNKIMEDTTIQQKVKEIPTSVTNDVKSLATHLGKVGDTELEKVWAIYYWICHNIAYNAEGFFSGRLGDCSAAAVLKTRRTVCSGYADLFLKLCQEMGLEAKTIIGYAKGYGYKPGTHFKDTDHAWSAVKVSGSWHLLDACWGAGSLSGSKFEFKFNTYYFLTPPNCLIYNHLPAQEEWQLLPEPWTLSKYEDAISLSAEWFNYNLELVSHEEPIFKADESVTIKIKSPADVILSASLVLNGTKIQGATFVQKLGNIQEIDIVFQKQGQYKLSIFARRAADKTSIGVLEYTIEAKGSSKEELGFPETFSTFGDNNCYLYSHKGKSVKEDTTYKFKISVNNAETVQIVTNNVWIPLTKSQDSNIFEGEVKIKSADTSILANFNGSESHFTLVRYS